MNFSHEPAQYRPGPYLNIRCDALGRKARDDGLPADRRRDLRDERLDGRARVALRLGVHVGDDWHARRVVRSLLNTLEAMKSPNTPRTEKQIDTDAQDFAQEVNYAVAALKFHDAIWFILAACIFDMLDGRLARLGGHDSSFGREFDFLC